MDILCFLIFALPLLCGYFFAFFYYSRDLIHDIKEEHQSIYGLFMKIIYISLIFLYFVPFIYSITWSFQSNPNSTFIGQLVLGVVYRGIPLFFVYLIVFFILSLIEGELCFLDSTAIKHK